MDRPRFGPFRLDPETLELWYDRERIPIEPLNARILLRLVEGAGQLVRRRELLELGWPELPDAAEQSLNNSIHQIRRALAQNGDASITLETLRGRGYRLAVPDSETTSPAVRRTLFVRVGWAAAFAVAALAVAFGWRASIGNSVPVGAARALERALYLAETTGDLAAARAELDGARIAFPDVALLEGSWGELSFWLGDYESAERGVENALRLDPDLAVAHRGRGLLAMVTSDWNATHAALDEALRLDPSDTRTLTSLALWRVIEGRVEEADAFIRQALDIDPLSTILHRDLGYIYLLAGRYPEAERSCREVLRFQPGSEWATECLFDLMVLQNRVEDAATWGQRLLEITGAPAMPNDASATNVVAGVEAWRLDRWTRWVRDGAYPYGLAFALVANDRPVEALGALKTAAATPRIGLLSLGVDPRLAPLRERDEFRDILHQLRLPG